MLLLAVSSLLLFFITYALGKGTLAVATKWLQLPLGADFLGVFFSGLIASYIYFNIVSFFAPVDYKTLAPLLLYCLFYFSKKDNRHNLREGFTRTLSLICSKENLPITFSFLAVLFLFWIIPPGNWDSGDYHYLSIRWYEEYAVVPGLANVHGRLAFNPANFIVSAAYSFTSLAGQPLYPLNGVIELLFFTWLLRLIFQQTSAVAKTILLAYAIMKMRDTLINITSPSSDLLVMIVLSYCAISIYQLIVKKEVQLSNVWLLLVLTAFGPCAKLSGIPTLLLIPFLWFSCKDKKTVGLFFKTAFTLTLLWVPWLMRNAVMTGYFLYPVKGTNLIAFDWTIPKDVLLLEDFYTRYSSRGYHNAEVLASMNQYQLMAIWAKQSIRNSIYPFTFAVAAFVLPPLAGLYLRQKKLLQKTMLLFLGIYYLAIIIWLIYSPEYRFGITLLQLLLLFTFLQVERFITIAPFWLQAVQMAALLFMVGHFSFDFIARPSNSHLSVEKHWFFPAKDYRLLVDDHNKQTFPYVMLRPGIPLYLSDSTHNCMNACLPCMSWRYGEIEMRGATLQQGFRNVKNEVRKSRPWLPK